MWITGDLINLKKREKQIKNAEKNFLNKLIFLRLNLTLVAHIYYNIFEYKGRETA